MTESYLDNLVLILPLLVLTAGALITLLVDVFRDGRWPKDVFAVVTLLGGLFSLWAVMGNYSYGRTAFSGYVYVDQFSGFVSIVILLGAILSVLIGMRDLAREGIEAGGEYYALLIMSTIGAIIFVSAAELITLFLGLEIMSMALYCMCGSALKFRRSSESALKYFLLGSFSSAFMLYGIALLYGISGSTMISEVAHAASGANLLVLSVAMGLLLVGFIFKIGAIPFHFWAPDVYEGAPTPVTAYMASVVKAAAAGAALRVLWSISGPDSPLWANISGVIFTVAVLTMIFGNLIALRQRSMKRMLAYSSIAHAGYILVAFLARSADINGGAAVLYYLLAYSVMTIGAFGVVLAVSSPYAAKPASDDITRFNALGYRKPFLAALMSLFMLSLAGIPPGMAGLLGKFYVFSAAVKANFVGLAVVGVICSAISCYYYLRVIVAMYFIDIKDAEDYETSDGLALKGALVFCGLAVILLGVFPSTVYQAASAVMAGF